MTGNLIHECGCKETSRFSQILNREREKEKKNAARPIYGFTSLKKPHSSFSTLLILRLSSKSIAISRARDMRIREWIECDG